MCATSLLWLDSSSTDDADKLVIKYFEEYLVVVARKRLNFFERYCRWLLMEVKSSHWYCSYKSLRNLRGKDWCVCNFECLTRELLDNIVVIASQTQLDRWNEKVGILLKLAFCILMKSSFSQVLLKMVNFIFWYFCFSPTLKVLFSFITRQQSDIIVGSCISGMITQLIFFSRTSSHQTSILPWIINCMLWCRLYSHVKLYIVSLFAVLGVFFYVICKIT